MKNVSILGQSYSSFSSITKIFISVFLMVIFVLAGFRFVMPLADYALSSFQWIFDYYPEDVDPVYFLSLIVADLLFAVSMTVFVLRIFGTRLSNAIVWICISYVLLISFTWLIFLVGFWIV